MKRLLAKIIGRGPKGLARLARFARHQGAATAVEFAFIAPILIALLLATLQISVVFLAQSYLAAVADATARDVLTNKTSGLTATQFQADMCSHVAALFTCNQIIVSLQAAPTTQAGIAAALPKFDANGNLIGTPTLSAIGYNTKALLVIMYQWPVISGPLGPYVGTLGNGNFLLTTTEVLQTEPCVTTPTNVCT